MFLVSSIVIVMMCLQLSNDPSPGYNIEQMAKRYACMM